MAAITKIEFWSDVGFIDGAVEIPRLAAADPTNPDMVIEPDDPIMPSKDRFFSELKLKEYYTGLLTMSYMRITYDLKNSLGIDTPNVFYGWIDKVDLSSDGEYPMTIVSWHIDEWRTWKNAITFGSGHVKRRPYKDLATTPIQNYPLRYLKLDSGYSEKAYDNVTVIPLNPQKLWWVIFSYTSSSGTSTIINTCAYPIYEYRDDYGALMQYSDGTVGTGPGYDYIKAGLFEDYMGIAAEALIGVWLSPVCPFEITTIEGSGLLNTDPIIINKDSITGYSDIAKVTLGIYTVGAVQDKVISTTKTLVTPFVSSEEERYILTDTSGMKILDLPYGMSIDHVDTTLVVEADNPYVEFSFRDSSYGNTEGTTVNIPLTSFPVNENAYNAYVYSGQREYDKNMRNLMSTANAWKTTSSGVGTGAMMGAFGTLGLLAGAGGGAIGGLTSYLVEMNYQNDAEQRLEDRLKAQQIPSLLLSSNSFLPYARKYGFTIKRLVPDDYSEGQLTATRNQFGVSVDELMSSCDTLIRSTSPTGYYNIQNMIVNGNVPVSAKKWIREKFRSGVRLI